MKNSFLKYIFLIVLLLSPFSPLAIQAAEEDLFDNPMVRDEISLKHRPIYFDNEDRIDLDGKTDNGSYLPKDGWLEYHFLSNRRALTGESCAINKLPSSVSVGSWPDNLNALLNDDLDDYCEFNGVVNVGVTVNPLFSIRDRSCYYAKGCEAGFVLIASGVNVLSLDVVKAMAIGFYRDGELVKVVPAKEGQDGSGVTLSLIQVPGSEDACVCVTADAPGVFDEIALDYSGGVTLSAGQNIRVKYGFVGKSRMFTITKNKKNGAVSTDGKTTPFQKYNEDNDNRRADLDYVKGWNPFALGLPIPVLNRELEKFIDEDLDNYMSLTPILAIGYQGGGKFMMKDPEIPDREIFDAGTEVGFCYDFGGALSLDAGSFLNIVLFDRNGNKVSEETVSAGVLGLSVAKGGGGSTSIIAKVPFSGAEIRFLTVLSVDLGGIFLKYAYVREKADIRHHCPINPSMDTPICIGNQEYHLRSNPAVSVTWTIERQPEGGHATVTPDGYAKGIEPIYIKDEKGDVIGVEQEYVFRAQAADGCFDLVTLTADGFATSECQRPMVNPIDEAGNPVEDYVVDAHAEGVDGSLITIDDIKNPENILKDDNSYASYVGGLKLANHIPIIGIRRTAGNIWDFPADRTSPNMRVGFIVESAVEGLNLSVLDLYHISLYKTDSEGKQVRVYDHLIDENNTISADIGGANKALKVRFSISVPNIDEHGDEMVFNQMILWVSGVADVKLGELRIYNAFWEWEDEDSDCADIMGCSTTVLSTSDTHTTLDFNRMVMGEGVSVATVINDLDNMVDDDMESYTTIFKTVGVSGVTIAVNLGRTLDYRHQLGIVTDNNTYLAGVKLADVIQVKTLYRGEETGDIFNDWNVVDANVAGFGDKKYIIISPKYMYDEVLLTFVGTVNVLNDIRVYGLFVRGDADGDGMPDCLDSQPCSDLITSIEVNEICVGDDIYVTATGSPGFYPISFNAPLTEDEETDTKSMKIEIKETQNGGKGVFKYPFSTGKAGVYQVVIYNQDGAPIRSASYKVHPDNTQWLTTATTSDWTKWDNWTNGSPYCCTNVVIPSNATVYPDLSGSVTDGDEYCCNLIHFEPGAEVNRVTRLNYNRVWAELALSPNRYHLLSAPLQSMYSGDMFIPGDMSGIHSADYFTPLNSETSPQNRFNPTIYQRLWARTAKGRLWAGKQEVDIATVREQLSESLSTEWSSAFNHLSTPYSPGMGFSLWVDNGELPDNIDFRFRFPKEHTSYNYFSDFDREMLDMSESLSRENVGRFIYESNPDISPMDVIKIKTDDDRYNEFRYNDRLLYDFPGNEGELHFTVSSQSPTNVFLFGNPFMSRIDVGEFIAGNDDLISAVMFYDGNTIRKVAADENGSILGLDRFPSISPMQAVYVTTIGEPTDQLSIRITPDMLGPVTNAEAGKQAALRINLNGNGNTATMTVTEGSHSMISEALIENEVAPSLAIYSVDNGKAFDFLPENERIPLTIIKKPEEEAYLSFDSFNGVDREDYRIIDLVACKEYTLDHDIPLPVEMGSTSGRFILVSFKAPSAIGNTQDDSDIIVNAANGILHVASHGDRITSINIYTLDGKVIANQMVRNAYEVSLSVPQGVCVVEVTTANGSGQKFKLIVN
ncbi:MAG: T9SS type A sorting domain-containing protein [Muribaculaceae bacterium]|nr:T9SS type A sorting domain-containing protein [Muribaculaceae bacterium]